MVSQRVRGSIVFVSSFLGYTSFAGYSTYSPGKYALRGEPRVRLDLSFKVLLPTLQLWTRVFTSTFSFTSLFSCHWFCLMPSPSHRSQS
jgi:hypothetical protein